MILWYFTFPFFHWNADQSDSKGILLSTLSELPLLSSSKWSFHTILWINLNERMFIRIHRLIFIKIHKLPFVPLLNHTLSDEPKKKKPTFESLLSFVIIHFRFLHCFKNEISLKLKNYRFPISRGPLRVWLIQRYFACVLFIYLFWFDILLLSSFFFVSLFISISSLFLETQDTLHSWPIVSLCEIP